MEGRGVQGSRVVGGLLWDPINKEKKKLGKERWPFAQEKNPLLHTHALEEINPSQDSCVSSFSRSRRENPGNFFLCVYIYIYILSRFILRTYEMTGVQQL